MRGSSDRSWPAIPNCNQAGNCSQVTIQNPTSSDQNQSIKNPSGPKQSTFLEPHSNWSWNQMNKKLVTGYTKLVTDRIHNGWSCYLLTILFSQLPGRREVVINQMKDEVHRIYATFVTRVHRNPRDALVDELPLLVGSADLPVYKRDRTTAPLVRCNGGLHYHALLLMPSVTRSRRSVQEHFESQANLYGGPRRLVQKVHVQPIAETPERVVDYVFKTVLNNQIAYDDAVIVLPKVRQELTAA